MCFSILPDTPRLRVWGHQRFDKHTPGTGYLSSSLSVTIKQVQTQTFHYHGVFIRFPLAFLPFLSFPLLDTTDLAHNFGYNNMRTRIPETGYLGYHTDYTSDTRTSSLGGRLMR